MKQTKTLLIAESGIMLAFATILSMIEIVKLPYGGGITVFSMLPIIVIAYRRGVTWGLFTALAFGLIQMLLGLNNLSYATSQWAAVAIIALDYIVAFTVLGLGGVFRSTFKSQAAGLTSGTILVCVLRYISHVISGCTVWAGLSIPTADAFVYSTIYNATYMLPETLVTVVGAVTLSRLLDIRGEAITRAIPREKAPDLAILYSGIAKAMIAIAGITDIALVFSKIQSGETGEFDITQISAVNWPLFAGITVAAVILPILFFQQAKRVPADSTISLNGLFSAIPAAIVIAAAVFAVVFISTTLSKGGLDAEAILQIIAAAIAVVIGAVWVIRRTTTKKNRS